MRLESVGGKLVIRIQVGPEKSVDVEIQDVTPRLFREFPKDVQIRIDDDETLTEKARAEVRDGLLSIGSAP